MKNSSARAFGHSAALEMHPLDTEDRLKDLKTATASLLQHHQVLHHRVPEHQDHRQCDHPIEGRVVDAFYDPIAKLFRGLGRKT